MIISLLLLSYLVLVFPFYHNSRIIMSRTQLYLTMQTAKQGHQRSISMSEPNEYYFAGIKFNPPISTSLKRLGIQNPSPIQQAAISPLTSGLSCIIHAETGSGKTLAYLLPLLKRLLNTERSSVSRVEAVIVAPSKELTMQISSDIRKLLAIEEGDEESLSKLTYTSIGKSAKSLDRVTAPIVIGTPSTLHELIKASSEDAIGNISFLVLDEVDRLLKVLGKYATYGEKVTKDESIIPAEELLESIVAVKEKRNNLHEMQIVAASATVGRPLRRELSKLMDPHARYKDGFPTIRPIDTQSSSQSRAVSIPQHIKHQVIIRSDDNDVDRMRSTSLSVASRSQQPLSDETLTQKAVLIKEFWNHDYKHCKRGMIFVPTAADAKQMVGMMRFWGIVEAKNLHETASIADRMGMTASNPIDRELYIVSVSHSRGLHIKDVDCVFILQLPTNMDEYLHMAGRTGRYGNQRLDGSVITIVDYEELKRIQSWQVALGIDIDVKYR